MAAAMGCSTVGKGMNNKSGEKNGKGFGGGKGGASSSGKGGGSFLDNVKVSNIVSKQTAKFDQQFAMLEKKLEKANEKLEKTAAAMKAAGGASSAGGKQYWTCSACGDDRCFASRDVCHRCSEPRAGAPAKPKVQQPPGLPAAAAEAKAAPKAAAVQAAAAPMDTSVP